MGDKADKYETLRRLRFGDLRRLLQHRWGYVLPDDDAGRGDLWLLVTNCSLAAAEPEKKMAHVIEVWAPWMTPDELQPTSSTFGAWTYTSAFKRRGN